MLQVIKQGILFEKTPIEFENSGVLNPAIIQEGNILHVFYRAVSFNNYSTIGYCKLERSSKIVKRNKAPIIVPEFEYESHGVEDPRIIPIYINYSVTTLEKFTNVFEYEQYQLKMDIAFSWFLGNNHLHQIIYNPSTGGCYDGLEDTYININQGAESTVSYLMARLTMEKGISENIKQPKEQKKIAIKYEVAETL